MPCPACRELVQWTGSTPPPRLQCACGHVVTVVAPTIAQTVDMPPRELDVDATLPDILGRRPERTDAHYEVGQILGRGGMGEVILVRDRDLGRRVVMKTMLADVASQPRTMRRFLEEARVTSQLEHPNIVPIHEFGLTADERPFFTMKHVQGDDLDKVIRQLARGSDPELAARWTLAARLQLFLAVCNGVAFAHSHDVLHRDLKPANIMVGGFGEVLVMDWGLAKTVELEQTLGPATPSDSSADGTANVLTMDGEILGTPYYMAPEQARGEIDQLGPTADIYSLGAILLELLLLRRPYQTPNLNLLLMRVSEGDYDRPGAVESDPDVPYELRAVIARAMELAPADRYQTVGDLAEDVQAFLDGRLVSAVRYTPGERVVRWLGRHWRGATTTALVVVAVVAGALGMRWREQARERRAAEALAERKAAFVAACKQLRAAQTGRIDAAGTLGALEALRDDVGPAALARALGDIAERVGLLPSERGWLTRVAADWPHDRQRARIERRRGGMLVAAGDEDGALGAYATAYRLDRDSPAGTSAALALARLHRDRGQMGFCLDICQTVAERAKRSTEHWRDALSLGGEALLALGRHADARATFAALRHVGPGPRAARIDALLQLLGGERPVDFIPYTLADVDGRPGAEALVKGKDEVTLWRWRDHAWVRWTRVALPGVHYLQLDDHDADGLAEIVARCNREGGSVVVVVDLDARGQETGRATSPLLTGKLGHPWVRDVDADGAPEIVVQGRHPSNRTLVLRRQGDRWSVARLSHEHSHVAAARVLPGSPHLLVASNLWGGYAVTTYRTAPGAEPQAISQQRFGNLSDLRLVDLDRDGRPEACMTLERTGTAASPWLFGAQLERCLPAGVVIARIDEDLRLHPLRMDRTRRTPGPVRAVADVGGSRWIVYSARGSTVFFGLDEARQVDVGGISPYTMADLDGDGDLELLARRGRQLLVLGAGGDAPDGRVLGGPATPTAHAGEAPALGLAEELARIGQPAQAIAVLEELAGADGKRPRPGRDAAQAALRLIDLVALTDKAGALERARWAAQHPLAARPALWRAVDLSRELGRFDGLGELLAALRALPGAPAAGDVTRLAALSKEVLDRGRMQEVVRWPEDAASFRSSMPPLAEVAGSVVEMTRGPLRHRFAAPLLLKGDPWRAEFEVDLLQHDWGTALAVGLWPVGSGARTIALRLNQHGSDWHKTTMFGATFGGTQSSLPDGALMTAGRMRIVMEHDAHDNWLWATIRAESGKQLARARWRVPPLFGWYRVGVGLHQQGLKRGQPFQARCRVHAIRVLAGAQPRKDRMPADAPMPPDAYYARALALLRSPAELTRVLAARLAAPATAPRDARYVQLLTMYGALGQTARAALNDVTWQAAGQQAAPLVVLVREAFRGRRWDEALLAIDALEGGGGLPPALRARRLQLMSDRQIAARVLTTPVDGLPGWLVAGCRGQALLLGGSYDDARALLERAAGEARAAGRADFAKRFGRQAEKARWVGLRLSGRLPSPSLKGYKVNAAYARLAR